MSIPFILSAVVSGLFGGLISAFIMRRAAPASSVERQLNTTFLFSGNLQQTSIVDAIQFLEIGKREGILHIYCGRRKGYITFAQGKVIDAFYRNKTAREAMYEMLSLHEGDFYFESRAINQPRLTADSIMDLVMGWDANQPR
jgi:hypothetical protein